MKKLLLLFTLMVFVLSMYAQVTKTLNMVAAGTLSSVLTPTELTSVTNLTLTGTIDARDFKTMRDEMPILSEIDLDGTTVAAYYGSDGTNSSNPYHQNIIPASAFYNKNGLKKIILPSEAIEIKPYAFYGCSDLISVNIHSLVTVIGDFAFYGCPHLTTLFLPASIWTIGERSFSCGPLTVDPNNQKFSSVDGVLFNKVKTALIQYPVTNNENYIIPSSVNIIGPSAFAERKVLKSVTIPTSVEYIESNAFNGCSGLTSLILPNSVWSIRVLAFYGCTGLTSLTIPSRIGYIESGVFSGCTSLSSIYTNHLTPLSLNNAADFFSQVDKSKCKLYVPYGTRGLYSTANQWKDFTNVEEMPGFHLSVTQVEVEGTENSTTTVDIESNVEWTVSSGFSWLTMSPASGTGMGQKLTITAKENPLSTSRQGIITISSTNMESQNLTVIQNLQQQLPKTLKVTPGSLFSALTATERNTISNLTLSGTIDARDFKTMRDNMPLLAVLDLSGVNIAEYHGGDGTNIWWFTDYPSNTIPVSAFVDGHMTGKTSLTSVILPSSMTSFGAYAFKNCSGIKEISIPQMVTDIGSNTFDGCSGLKSVTIPSSLTKIGVYTFNGCSGLTTVTIPPSIISIGESCFSYCNSLGSVLIPSSVTTIGSSAFQGCKSLTSINLPSSIDSIGQGAFNNCTGLKSANIPYLITKIGAWFDSCTSLDSISIPSSVTTIGSGAFIGCSSLTSVIIPSSVISIGENAFQNCTGLKSVTIGSSVANIGNYAFNNCSKLTSLTVEANVPPVISLSAMYVFNNVDKNVCALYIPDGTTSIYTITNQWKDFKNIVEASDVIVPTNFLQLSSQSVILASNAGSTATVNITSDSEWTANSGQSWITINPNKGTGDNILTFTAEANLSNGSRQATVTVSSPRFESKTITVTQFGSNASLTLSPGSLATVLSSDVLSSVSNLTLTGTIDARDFKTMRDKMPLLAVLDLSGVTIAAYSGNEGPNLPGNTQYPANTIPLYAFREPRKKTSAILNSVILPSSLNSIGYAAFAGCDKLTTLSIPPNVTFIDQNAFDNCTGLTSVLFPSSQIYIGNYAFIRCVNLASVTMKGVVPPNENYTAYVFYGVNMDYCTLYVPYGTTSRYAYADLWSDFGKIIEPSNGFLLSSFSEKLAVQEGSTVKVNITANVNWTAISDQPWLSVSPAQGSANQTITFTARENTAPFARKARVTISANNIEPQTIIITQDGANLTLNLSPGSLTSILTSDELQTVTSLTITGTIDARDFKTIREKMPMLTKLDIGAVTIAEYSGSEGTNWNTIYPANTIPDHSFYETNYHIIPNLNSIVLPKSVTSINGFAFGYPLTSLALDYPIPPVIDNPNSWNIDSNCTLYVPYGAANSYKANTKWREFSHIVEATQGFHLSTYQPTLAGEDGSRTTVDLTANVDWTLSSNQDWLEVSPVSGNGNQTLIFIAKANPLFSTRTAKVTISGTGVSSQTITLTQNFQIQPLKTLEVTAGGLSTALSADELNTISKLTLTGTIDARDFKTMRDKMPVLAELDISGANIVAYNGNEGTNLWGDNMEFPDNTIPETAFSSYNPSDGKYYGKLSLNSVIIPTTTISIGHSAFYGCVELTSFSIPLSVTSIESEAFRDCKSLASITIPSTVKSIQVYAYFNCVRLKAITVNWLIPLNIKSNYYNIFDGFDKTVCTLYVPYGTTNRYAAANQWKDFTNIVEMPGFILPETTAEIEAAEGSKSSVDINSDVEWTASSEQTWLSLSPSSGLGISQKLTFTANGNSSFTPRVATVTVSSDGLESQTIQVTQEGAPLSITAGSLATLLTTEELNTITKLTLTGTIDARDFKTMRDKMPLLAELDLSGVAIVAYKGIEGTSLWGNNDYPANAIPESAFYYGSVGKSTLTSVALPLSLTSIGQSAFNNCIGIKNIIIPSIVTSIEYGAFHNCQNLTTVNIPSLVYSIGSSAFFSCKGLTALTVGCSVPPDLQNTSNVFYSVNKNTCILHVPYGTSSRYATAYQWKDFLNIEEATEGFYISSNTLNLTENEGSTAKIDIVSNVNWTASSDQTWLSVSPASGTGIGQKLTITAEENPLFTSRTAYVTVSAPGVESQSITVIQAMKPQPPKTLEVTAGTLSSILTSIELNTITDLTLTGTIDARDFKTMRDNMPLLSKLNLYGATIVEYNGTEGTSIWQNNDYPVNTIPEFAFVNSSYIGKTSLTSVELPSSMTSFGQYSFLNCSGIKDIIIPSTVNSIGNYVFYNCAGLFTINIPIAVNSIGDQSFGYLKCPIIVDLDNSSFSSNNGVLFNKGQTELIQCPISKTGYYTIPEMVLSIGNKSFSGCSGLTTVMIPSSVTSIGENAFYYCTGLSSIYSYPVLPVNLETSKYVFYNVNKPACTLYVPSGSKSAYQTANQWKEFTKVVEFNPALVANAGPDQVIYEGTQVTLDGTGSTKSNLTILNYIWTAPTGITLSSTSSSKPSFTAPEVTSETKLTFSLIVNDGSNNSIADQVVITVKQVNKAPIANAGVYQTVNEGVLVNLDGTSSSDPDNNALTYKWTAPVGITLSSDTASKPTFIAPEVSQDNSYVFTLVVNDSTLSSMADQVRVTVKQVNKTPIANAGVYQTVNEGVLVNLDGTSSSDPDNNALTYKWTAPAGIILSSDTVSKPTFIAPEVSQDTSYVFTLVVNDSTLSSTADQVRVTVKQVNKAPIADAGVDQIVDEGVLVNLDGTSSSDPDNNVLTYKWTAPAEIILILETASKPTFIAPEVSQDTSYVFTLVVNDSTLSSTADQVRVTVKQVNKTPIANAGTNQSVNKNSTVTLDGSASTDRDNDELSYLWTAPAGITLNSETAKNPTFTAPEVSQDIIYTFTLVVNDGKTDSDTSKVNIMVKQVLPILKLVSKTSDSQIPSNEVIYQLYLKKGNSFYEESVTPAMNGDTTEFSIEPGEWIVLASPIQYSSTFVPTYCGNTLEWISAEHIIIPDNGKIFKEITCLVPVVANHGTGQISGYVYEKTDIGSKSISITNTFEASGNPIHDALIRLFKKDYTVPIISILTDSLGFYIFEQLEISEYEIVVEIPGLTQSGKFDIILSNDIPVTTAFFKVGMTSQVITDSNPSFSSIVTPYPNPTKGIINVIGLPSNRTSTIAIYTIEGKIIKEKTTRSGTEFIDISDQISGIYVMMINNQPYKIWKK